MIDILSMPRFSIIVEANETGFHVEKALSEYGRVTGKVERMGLYFLEFNIDLLGIERINKAYQKAMDKLLENPYVKTARRSDEFSVMSA